MSRTARRIVIDEANVGVYHCVSRCVRRAMLLGDDPVTGKNFDERRDWILAMLQMMARFMAIDIVNLAIMANHIHLILRNRPDLVRNWSNKMVARRWLWLYPKRRDKEGNPKKPSKKEIEALTRDKKKMKELRKRLSSISWFHKRFKERIAKTCNKIDEVTGHFWEGRFRCTRLANEASVLACNTYVDLNPIRAKVAKTPEESKYTGAFFRIAARQARLKHARGRSKLEALLNKDADNWLSPMYTRVLPEKQRYAEQGTRASDMTAIPVELDQYLKLLDWTGRQIRKDKRGSIPTELAPILERLEVNDKSWVESIKSFGEFRNSIVGHPDQLDDYIQRNQGKWMKGVERCRQLFTRPESS